MSSYKVLDVNDDLPIRTKGAVHSGKVRSVYWLTDQDSARLIEEKGYDVPKGTELAIMVISDRISAFDCIWQGENGLNGVPGKGIALNSVAAHWFKLFDEAGLAGNHIVDIPHPYVWIVRKASTVRVEAIARQYITGSMWRDYSKGIRDFCGIQLPEGLQAHQKLEEVLITPSTKGIISGVEDVPEVDDVNITRKNITDNLDAFNFKSAEDVTRYEQLLSDGFNLISKELNKLDQIFVDTKFEFGYVEDSDGETRLIYIDEVGTPDSSRIWDGPAYRDGKIVENSKEGFRQLLINNVPDSDVLLNKDRMPERESLAQSYKLPQEVMMSVSNTYVGIASKIVGNGLVIPQDPRAEVISILDEQYGLID
ncbi:phosphoribosylaminoimidazolesuccinocarboxamide synthase [Pseudoalteromonas luteoviolacea]|uniref:Phosphoribosylaminoimidazole-succinocarboxamide synthase n=1 Tax=Pseudoalteromonas luteoviolacea S4054 TaxID=1129367 RepID=A0A0F6A7H3_9GAMM|nr:phosphoribosylaminoimidazolesuccinocarboxamide synthase [Pseudoalteromonas luteoviolacea]AOT06769.1 phosphoribosylaminoimidazolesuccinocarboxamide synthase [Pseudoalteromonas luteoviolacea]AOT11687.1 phosphoribosylaminoimidazolesuccinocarboxamide synthase [Pseudoalteromonas luteoviolacea]AOT16599.1 phosphoribosylaminoimidazolesuccinocarboxamide synthase [Pseudoalteromonas luteoviolacea]KKE82120.1 phosphoribosylaminoimidazole-succinocarboxamide synthase [Pseudoalteromonas luteoviolacea S4054]